MTEFPTNRSPRKRGKKPQHSSVSDYVEVLRRLPPKKKQQLILFCGGAVLALVLIVILMFKLIASATGSTSSSYLENIPSSVSGSTAAADKDYDKNANAVNDSEYQETILPESKDAGQDYIDETLFIGDSNTARMMSYGFTTLDNDIGTVSMGIQHVTAKKCAFFKGYEDGVTIPQAVKIMQPRRIIITFGTNNTIGWSAQTFVTEYKKALDAIHEAYPYADIIINSVPPVHRYRDNPAITMQTIDSFNKALVNLAKEEGYKFLNSSEVLKAEETGFAKWDYTISDGIHMNKEAMTALFSYFRTHSYITEDQRPALKKVPARLEAPYDIITQDPLAVHAEKTPSPSSSETAKDYTVSFGLENAEAGKLEGATSQKLALGEKTTAVKAVPNAGYVFSHWTINVGSIDDKNPELVFTLKLASEKNISIVAHFTKAATPTPSPTITPTPSPTVTPTPPPATTTPPPATPTPPPATPTPPPATPTPPPATPTPPPATPAPTTPETTPAPTAPQATP